MNGQERTAWQGCVEAEQPAGQAGRVVVECFAGDENEVRDTIRPPGADDELRPTPVVAHECDLIQVEFHVELGDHVR